MSYYSIQLRYILMSGFEQNLSYQDYIEKGRKNIFKFDYPHYVGGKDLFEVAFCKKFYMREISAETVEQFILFLDEKLNRIMPYYNDLLEASQLEFDPLKTIDLTEIFDGSGKRDRKQGTNDSTVSSDNTNTHSDGTVINSDFPQAQLNNLDYASNGVRTINDGRSNTTGTVNTDGKVDEKIDDKKDHIRHTYGTQQNMTDLMVKYRDSIRNILDELLTECTDLFEILRFEW